MTGRNLICPADAQLLRDMLTALSECDELCDSYFCNGPIPSNTHRQSDQGDWHFLAYEEMHGNASIGFLQGQRLCQIGIAVVVD